MKYLFTTLLSCICAVALAQQPDNNTLKHAVADLDRALIGKDSVALKWILNDKLVYGHSNGWTETKRELIGDLFNGKLSYTGIKPAGAEIITEGTAATVRYTADVDVAMEGKAMQFKLKILQVWLWENEHWVLFARQSVKS